MNIVAFTPAFLCAVAAVLSRVPAEKRGQATYVFQTQEDGSVTWAKVTGDKVEASTTPDRVDLSKIQGWKAGDTGALTLGRDGKRAVVLLWSRGGGFAYVAHRDDNGVEVEGTERVREIAKAVAGQGLGHPIAVGIFSKILANTIAATAAAKATAAA